MLRSVIGKQIGSLGEGAQGTSRHRNMDQKDLTYDFDKTQEGVLVQWERDSLKSSNKAATGCLPVIKVIKSNKWL